MKLVILGSGGYGRTLMDIAEQLGYEILTVLDDKIPNRELATFSSYIASDTYFIPAFGNNEFRLSWIERLQDSGAQLATLIHPTAYISPKATIHPGAVVLPGAIVNTNVTVGKGVIVNIGCIVDHDVILEDCVHLAPGAIVKGENRIRKCTKIESGEVVQARQW